MGNAIQVIRDVLDLVVELFGRAHETTQNIQQTLAIVLYDEAALLQKEEKLPSKVLQNYQEWLELGKLTLASESEFIDTTEASLAGMKMWLALYELFIELFEESATEDAPDATTNITLDESVSSEQTDQTEVFNG